MHVIVIGRRKFTGPSCWEEITPRHYLQLLNWRVKLGGDAAGKFVLFQLWFGVRYRTSRLLSNEQRVDLLALLDFLEERPDRWILSKIRVKSRTYLGPGDSLDHLTFGEFMHAQAARDKFLDNGDECHLSELMASLYRPKAFFWQPKGEARRSLFNNQKIIAQTNRMAPLPVSVHHAVVHNFEGCLDRFPEQFTYLFGKSAESDSGGSWLDVGLSLARQTSALGSFKELEQTNLFLVLTMLDAIMKENQELKKQIENG